MSELTLDDLMAQDAEQSRMELPSTEKLTDLTYMVEKLTQLGQEVAELETLVKDKQAAMRRLSEIDIPDLFQEMGNLKSLELSDGRKVTVTPDFSLTIKKSEQEQAFAWLRENGKEEIIKRSLSLQFDRGEQDEAARVAELLLQNNLSYSDTETVHPQTLKASLKGTIEEGRTPPDCFNYYPYKKTVIK